MSLSCGCVARNWPPGTSEPGKLPWLMEKVCGKAAGGRAVASSEMVTG